MEDTEINITKEKSMDELRFNIVNSAIEDKHRMDTEFYKQHEIQFSCNSSEYNCGWRFFVCFCSEKGLCSHNLGRRGVIHKR